MKTIKKLTLKKESIVNLENKEMNGLKGGQIDDLVVTWNGNCATMAIAGCPNPTIGACIPAGYSNVCGNNAGVNVAASGAATCAGYTWGYVC